MMNTNNFHKMMFLGIVANNTLSKSEYTRLVHKAIKGYKNNIPQYDEDKLYQILKSDDRIKPYLAKYDEVKTLLVKGEFNKVSEIINNVKVN